jgi:hypothetical protein
MNPNGYPYPSVGDIALAVKEGLLTRDEARAAVLELFPAAKRIADAKAIIAQSEVS